MTSARCRGVKTYIIMSLNKVMLIGNVGRDPEVRYLDGNSQSGTKVATFTLATSERYKDRNGELRENTEWHNIVCWRANADVAERFVHKGTQLYIEGRLRTRSYTDPQGVKKYTTEIQVDTLQLLGRREDGEAAAPQGGYSAPAQSGPAQPTYSAPAQPAYSAPAAAAPAAAQAPVEDIPADDLPF